MQTQSNVILFRFSPEHMPEATLRQLLTGKEKFLEQLTSEIKESVSNETSRYILIVGPRGIGKSHLMTVLYYEVKEKLSNQITPIKFAEEEYSIFRASDLFLRALELGESNFNIEEIKSLNDEDLILEAAVEQLKQTAKKEKKQYLFFIENLHLVFDQLEIKELQKLRSILQKNKVFSIVASAPITFKGISEHEQPFYNFFKIQHLYEFSLDQTKEFMEKIATLEENYTFIEEFETYEKKIEGIYHLTGGSPRLIVLLYEIITRGDFEGLEKIFLKMMDEYTPYYQEIFQMLSSQRRLILDTLMTSPSPLTPKDIAIKSRLDEKVVNQQLRRLETDGYLISHRMKKRTSYEVRERLFRLWRDMRMPLGKNRISIFIDFLTCWYTPEEREEKFKNIFETLSPNDKSRIKEVFYFAESLPPECRVQYLHNYIEKLTKLGADCEAYITLRNLRNCVDQIQDDKLKSSIFNEDGRLLTSKKKYEKALSSFDLALKINPHDLSSLHQKCLLLNILDNYKAALETINYALEIDPNNVSSLKIKAKIFVSKKDFKKALEIINGIVILNPKDPEVYDLKSSILSDLERYEDALEAINTTISLSPENSRAYHSKSFILTDLDRYEDALEAINTTISLSPEDSRAYHLKSIILSHLERYEDALEAINITINLNSSDSDLYGLKAAILSDLEHYEDALEAINTTISLSPEDSRAYHSKSFILSDLERYEDALEAINTTISLSPEDSTVYYLKTIILTDLDRYEDALEAINTTIRLNPENSMAYYLKSIILSHQERYEDALKALDHAIEIDPSDTSILLMKAELLAFNEDFENALEAINTIISLNPKESEVYALKSSYLYELKHYGDALKTLDHALKIDPNNVPLLKVKVKSLASIKSFENALEVINTALILNPDDPEIYFLKSTILYELKRYEEALDIVNKAININPNNEVLIYLKCEIIAKMGDYAEALNLIERAIKDNSQVLYTYQKIKCLLFLKRFNEVVTIVKNTPSLNDYLDLSSEFRIVLIEAYIKLGDKQSALIEIERLKDSIKDSDSDNIIIFCKNLFDLSVLEFISANYENGRKLIMNAYSIEKEYRADDINLKSLTIDFLKELINSGDIDAIEVAVNQIILCKGEEYRWFIKPLTDALEIIKTQDVRIYYRDLQAEEREVVAEIVKKITKDEKLLPQNF